MRNKRLFFKLLVMTLIIALAIIFNPVTVHASDDDNYLVVVTKIQNYNNFGEVTLVKEDDASGSISVGGIATVDYTKKVVLSDDTTYSSGDVEITDYAGASTGTDIILMGDNGDSGSYTTYFQDGSTVYLLEIYEFDSDDFEYVTQSTYDFNIPNADYLKFDYTNDYLNAAALENYPYSANAEFNPEVHYEGLYSSSDVTDGRDVYDYLYFTGTGSAKSRTIEKGTIVVPNFFASFNGSVYGNLVPYGSFSFEGTGASISSTNSDPTRISYSNLIAFANSTVSYSASDDSYLSANGEHSFYRSQSGKSWGYYTDLAEQSGVSYNTDSEGTPSYTYERSMTVSENRDNPTGVFLNILPFVVAIVIAGVGVVLLKKNSIK